FHLVAIAAVTPREMLGEILRPEHEEERRRLVLVDVHEFVDAREGIRRRRMPVEDQADERQRQRERGPVAAREPASHRTADGQLDHLLPCGWLAEMKAARHGTGTILAPRKSLTPLGIEEGQVSRLVRR